MKIIFLLKNVYLQCFYHAKFFLLTTVLVAVSYAVLMTSLSSVLPTLSSKGIWNIVSNEKIENVYKVNMWENYITGVFDRCSFESFVSEINEIDGVKGAGLFFMESVFSQGEWEDTLFVSEELLQLFPLKDINGDECSFPVNETETPVIVGYNLQKKYPVGTVFCNSNVTYRVTGALKRNSCWLAGQDALGQMVCLNNMFVLGVNHSKRLNDNFQYGNLQLGMNNLYYFVKSDTDRNQIRQDVIQIAEDDNLRVSDVYRMRDIVDDAIEEIFMEPEGYLMPLSLIVLATLIMLLSAVFNVVVRKRNIGVMYTIGYSGRDIARIYTIENAIKLLLGIMIAIMYFIRIMDQYVKFENCISLIWYVLPATALIALLMLFTGEQISLKYIRNISVTEVIGGMRFDQG